MTIIAQQPNLVQFYRNHPQMRPHIGCNYRSPYHKKLLLVGESFYMPKGSNVHQDVRNWYYGNKLQLTQKEKDYTDTEITRYNKQNLTSNVGKVLQKVYRAQGYNAWEEVAFINYLMRPADNGDGAQQLKIKTKPQDWNIDRAFALYNLLHTIAYCRPDIIVFLSKNFSAILAENDYRCEFTNSNLWDYTGSCGVSEYIYVYHPSQPCWRAEMTGYKKYDVYKRQKPPNKKYPSCDFFRDWLYDNW